LASKDSADVAEEVSALARRELAVFANLCMVCDDRGRVLVQERRKPPWSGVAFPGGHVEPGESFTESVIREVYEETGLTLLNPVLCGVKQFPVDDARYVIFLYKANRYTGRLRSSDEGEVFWVSRGELPKLNLALHMMEMLPIFEQETPSEFYYYLDDGVWKTKIL